MSDERIEATAEMMEELANMLRGGAVYLGHRRDGLNDEFEFGSLLFKWPRQAASESSHGTRRP